MKAQVITSFLAIILATLILTSNAQAQETVLLGAMSSVDITPPAGVPLGGFGGGARRIKGYYDWGNKYPYATYLTPSQGSPLLCWRLISFNEKFMME